MPFTHLRAQRGAYLIAACFSVWAACSSYDDKLLPGDKPGDAPPVDGGGNRPTDAATDAQSPNAGNGGGNAGASGNGGAGTAGSGTSGSGAGGSSGGPCRPNPDTTDDVCTQICPEACNGLDDDCDLRVDEEEASDACAAANATALCFDGECVIAECTSGFRDCDGKADTGCEAGADDVNNCGLCGKKCSVVNGTAGCSQGACVQTSCTSGHLDCDSDPLDCETPSNTLSDCGACNTACANVPHASPSCESGSCGVASCDDGYGNCDTAQNNGCELLLDTLTDCGACGQACSFPGTQASCANPAQVCTATSCEPGYDECNGDLLDGCEALDTGDNCGQCGRACTVAALQNVTTADCSSGACAFTCAGGWGDCDGDPLNGCETSLDSLAHCGSCNACPDLPNAVSACNAGACQLASCNQGFGDCSGGAADGCETPLDTNQNCGGCGVPCTKLSCGGGICTAIDCGAMPGSADCDGDGVTCETNLTSDLDNCGACANKCQFDAGVTMPHATLSCTSQSCKAVCEAGYADCDGNHRNGCEKPLNTLTDCGACGQGCAIANATSTCATETCLVATCNSDYADCDSDKKSCETVLNTPSNCGGCNAACALPNATAGCGGTPGARSCTVTGCTQTYYKNCDGTAANGCEIDTRTDVKNCSACGTDCNTLPNVDGVSCTSSACAVNSCDAGYGDCGAAPGCETDLRTLSNCGACGVLCARENATASCATGSCAIASCNAGFGSCDGSDANGCETPLGTQNNCSACGDVCSGYCKNGACAACASAADCSDGNACTVDTCTAGVCSWPAASAGAVCRAAAGGCDLAEVCDGTTAPCPADTLANAGTVCRAAVVGGCDVAETCPGGTTACPADIVVAAGTTCRASTGTCDGAEQCNGASNSCPADTNFAASSVVCRASAGACDSAETCTGSSNSCPANGKRPSGTVCRAAGGVCDVPETCDGVANACPSDGKLPSSNVCRAAVAGGCDVAEQCTGAGNDCPGDVVVGSGTVCRASTGTCDGAEQCNGTSNSCPADTNYAPSSTVCYASQGACDNGTLLCTGSSNVCPAVTYKSASTVCRASTGACDLAEQCSGSTAACPADTNYASSSTVCRAAVGGGCDVAESCTGNANACPADIVVAPGTVCRASTGTCDGLEQCDGGNACPPDTNYVSASTQCYASQGACDNGSLNCTGSSNACPTVTYKSSGTVCRAVAGGCDIAESCNGTTATCPNDAVVAAGTLCRGQVNICDAAEYCDGASASCATDAFAPVDTACGYTGGANAVTLYTTGRPSGTNANVLDYTTSPSTGYTITGTNPAVATMVPPTIATGWGSDAYRFSVTAPSSSGNAYAYWRWVAGNGTASGTSRALQTGDYIEYDVYLATNTDGIGGLDLKTNHASGATSGCAGSCDYFRDWTGWVDQNGVGGHPGASLVGPTNYAFGKWYHRRLAVPAGLVGNTITYVDAVDEHDGNSPATRVAYYDNLIISQTPGGCTGVAAVCLAKAGSNCTGSAQCISNSCVNGKCSACPDCEIGGVCYADGAANPSNSCQSCQVAVSKSAWSSVTNGTLCNDGDQCTHSDVCTAGACGGTAISCTSTTCQTRTCNGTASCTVSNAGSGTACTDDGNVCTLDQCDGSGACTHPAGNAGATCRAAAGGCDVAEVCDGSSASCPVDTLSANGMLCYASQSLCDSGNLYCDGATTSCPASTTVSCSNLDAQCHTTSSCNPSTGSCPVTTKKADGTACDDGNVNTVSDACKNGTCIGTIKCTVNAQCSGNQYCSSAGTCVAKLGNNATCSSAAQCLSAVCSGGNCGSCDYGGAWLIVCIGQQSTNNCDDNNPGTTDTCAAGCGAAGCQHATVANGTLCADDGNPCTTDTWQGGTCTHAAGNAGAVCGKSGDFCINDATCSGASTACPAPTNKSSGTTCDDNNSRTSNDVCDGSGVCKGT